MGLGVFILRVIRGRVLLPDLETTFQLELITNLGRDTHLPTERRRSPPGSVNLTVPLDFWMSGAVT